MRRSLSFSVLLAAGLLAVPALASTGPAAYLSSPLAFEANRGQADPAVRYLARGPGYTMLLAPAEVAVGLRSATGHALVRMRFVGGAAEPTVSGDGALAGRSHYLIGDDPARWRTDVPLFARVRYAAVYPGVDAVLYGNQRALEYDLVVAPGADPARIVLGFRGATGVTLAADGSLVLHAPGGDLLQRKPVTHQTIGGVRRPVDSAFVMLPAGPDGETRVGFRVAAYDRAAPLVIDPVLAYATYLGGPNANDGRAVAVDADGNAYVAGTTNAATFPNVGGLADPNDDLQGAQDAFVTKLSPTGAIVYSTYLGGGGSDAGNGIAVDDQGSAYVVGETSSSDFPTANALPTNTALQGTDGFVTKLNAAGNGLVYSTFLGGSASNENATAVAVDGSRNAYVTGTVFSGDFPTAGALPNNQNNGVTDAFVSKFAANGASLVYSLYLGGNSADTGRAIAVRNGEAYVTGFTQSTNFPLVSGLPAPNDGLRGFRDVFVTKVNATGSALGYSTYLSGSSDVDEGNAIAVDANGNAFVGGKTQSSNLSSASTVTGSLPAPNAAFRGGADGFVAKLAANGASLGFLAFLGGSSNSTSEDIQGLALDPDGNPIVIGQTTSNDFPVVDGLPLQNRRGQNNSAAIVTTLAAAGNAILFSTYLGGTRSEIGRAVAVDGDGNAFVTGQTASDDFPVVNAAQAAHGSGAFNFDVFVARIDTADPPALAYTPGHVFVSAIDYGEVREYTPTGTFVRALPLPSGAFAAGSEPAGIAFDAAGRLYVADTTQRSVFRFDATGAFDGAFVTGNVNGPQSLVFDAAGHLFVGTISGQDRIARYDADGFNLTEFDVFAHDTGALWMDLAADQRTLFYTTKFGDISVYDLDDGQKDDFFVEDVEGFLDFGVRHLPDGGALLAGRGLVRRLDANGAITKTYTPSPAAELFQVSRDPDGSTLWTAAQGQAGGVPGTVIAYDIANASVVHQFTGASAVDRGAVGGLAVFGELTEARDGAPVGTPTPMPTRTPAPEDCYDCIDNDFDTLVDRIDDDCPAPADGGEQGLTAPGAGKAILKCAKAIAKTGTKTGAAHQKALQKCVGAAFACVQQKPSDGACTTKATGTCDKQIGKLAAKDAKSAATIVKACGAAPLASADLTGVGGLGFANESDACAKRGIASLATPGDVAACVVAEHACRAENLVGGQYPRADELLAFVGRDADAQFPCLGAGSGGGDRDDRAKAVVKCTGTIAKAAAKFASARGKTVQKCAASLHACVQVKPADAKCRTKAGAGCVKQFAKLTAPGKGAAAKLAAAIGKSCTKAPLVLADVLATSGAGFDLLGGECTALGGGLGSITGLADCVARRHACRVDQMLENELPRIRELLAIAGVALP